MKPYMILCILIIEIDSCPSSFTLVKLFREKNPTKPKFIIAIFSNHNISKNMEQN